MTGDLEAFARALPKAELHVHIEGTLEPEMMFLFARRNGIDLPYRSAEEVRAAYEFTDLQSFLDVYYQGAAVLRTPQDFYDLMWAYLERAAVDNVRRAEIFFDAQTHTARGVPFEGLMEGLAGAVVDAREALGISAALILCFLRDHSAGEAMATLEEAMPFLDRILGVGLDSSEVGNPPEKFEAVFTRARSAGLRAVAHAGEEGPAAYIWGALDVLGAERIDHGVRCREDPRLVERLITEQIPLTMCPLSNVKLTVFSKLEDHSLKELFSRGVRVTVNSDDPAYFGGYVVDNYVAVAPALGLGREDLTQLARNSFQAAFLSDDDRETFLRELEHFVNAWED
jgi:adenosine deaminase